MNTALKKRQQNAKETLRHLTQVMEDMHGRMARSGGGEDVQAIKNLVQSMQTMTAALSLPHSATAPLFLGLSIASTGMNSVDSAAGIIGPSIAQLMQSLSDGFVAELMPRSPLANRRLLALSVLACYTLMACLASNSAELGMGAFPENLDQADLKSARVFTFELALLLANSSGSLEKVFKSIIEACGGDDKAQRIGAPLLAQIGNLLMIFAGTHGTRRKPAEVIADQEKYVQRGVNAAAAAIAKTSGNETPAIAAVSVALQQLQIAMDEKNYEECMETINTLLENLGTSWEALQADIKHLKKITAMITEAIGQKNEEPFTGAVHVA